MTDTLFDWCSVEPPQLVFQLCGCGTAPHPMTWLGVHRRGKWWFTEMDEKPIEHMELYLALGLGMLGMSHC